MLVPGTPIQSTKSTGLALSGATGYCYGIEEMENASEVYGDGTVYGEGTIAEYQNELICTREDYGYTRIQGKNVSAGYMFYAGNAKMQSSCNIMPIVYLDKNIKLEETGNQVNSCTEWKIHV